MLRTRMDVRCFLARMLNDTQKMAEGTGLAANLLHPPTIMTLGPQGSASAALLDHSDQVGDLIVIYAVLLGRGD